MTPPPSSSLEIIHEDPGAASNKRTRSKRKPKQDGPDVPATKRQSRPRKAKSPKATSTSLLNDQGAASPVAPPHDGLQQHPPVLLGPGHGQLAQQPQQPAPPVPRLRGKTASKALAKAAIGPPPGDIHMYQAQQLPPQPQAPFHSAQPPPLPRSTDYTTSNDYAAYQGHPWTGSKFPSYSPAPLQWGMTPSSSAFGHQSHEYVHYQPQFVSQQPASGTAARPIVLDDTPQPTPTVSSTGQGSLSYLPPKDSTNYADGWSENKENYGGYKMDSGMATTPSRYSFSAIMPRVWQTLDNTQESVQVMPTPLGLLDQRPGAPPTVLWQQDESALGRQPVSPASSAPPPPPPPAPPPVLVDAPPLCPEQAELVDLILKGHNVFYTGSAGCGKSTVLREFVRQLREMGKKVNIVAPTGRAALNVGGSTTWTYAGWTPNSFKMPLKKLMENAQWGKFVSERLKATDVLVIDEISMVENLHFERLNQIMKAARFQPEGQESAFGGCQIVVTGDFCQLPPVKPFGQCMYCGIDFEKRIGLHKKAVYSCRHHGEYADEDKWAFKSRAWKECNFQHRHLTTIHRQNDPVFIRILQKLRLGYQLSEKESTLLMDHPCRASAHEATKLFPLESHHCPRS